MQQLISVHGWNQASSNGLVHTIEDAVNKIRERAYSLFESRGGSPNGGLEDWLRAERDLFEVPEGEFAESESKYDLKMPAEGFSPEQIHIAVAPHCITVQCAAEFKEGSPGRKEEVERRELFRRFELGSDIDIERVKATLDDGMLMVELPKAHLSQTVPAGASGSNRSAPA